MSLPVCVGLNTPCGYAAVCPQVTGVPPNGPELSPLFNLPLTQTDEGPVCRRPTATVAHLSVTPAHCHHTVSSCPGVGPFVKESCFHHLFQETEAYETV